MWIRLACVTAATAMLLLAGSSGAVAQADADSDYLAMLSNYGLNATPDDSAALVQVGHTICTDLGNGTSAQQETDALVRILPNATTKQTGILVTVAQMKLCPGTQ
jgi:hypothetical protein